MTIFYPPQLASFILLILCFWGWCFVLYGHSVFPLYMVSILQQRTGGPERLNNMLEVTLHGSQDLSPVKLPLPPKLIVHPQHSISHLEGDR